MRTNIEIDDRLMTQAMRRSGARTKKAAVEAGYLILCEVLQGIREDNHFAEVRDELLGFHLFEAGGKELALASALNYRALRAHGYTIRRTIDCLIATFCLQAGHELLHRDRDFDAFEKTLGLRVIHP